MGLAGLLLDLLEEGAAHAGQPVAVVAFDGDRGQVAVPLVGQAGHGQGGQAGGGLVDLGGGQVEGVQAVAAQGPAPRDRVVADGPGGGVQAEQALDRRLVVLGQVLEAEGVGGPGVPGVGGDPGEVVEVAEQDPVEAGVQGGQVDLELVDVAVGVAAGQHGHGGGGGGQGQGGARAGVCCGGGLG